VVPDVDGDGDDDDDFNGDDEAMAETMRVVEQEVIYLDTHKNKSVLRLVLALRFVVDSNHIQ